MGTGDETAGMPFVFAVCGVKNSGKTRYMEMLIAALKGRGVRLAAVKHDGHEFEADVPGTDSSRMYCAGADIAAVYSGTQVSVHARRGAAPEQLSAWFSDCELVLLEGGKDTTLNKIEIVRSGNSSAAVSDPGGRMGIATDIAGFVPPGEGEIVYPLDDAAPLADWLMEHMERRRRDRERKDGQAMGKIWAVCTSPAKGTKKVNVHKARLIADWGLCGDAHAGRWHRQVSMLALEQIEAFRARGAEVPFGAFGENLVVSGYDLKAFPVGTRFRCGEAVLELTQVGKECRGGCSIYQAMGDCIMPREGVFCRVLQGGMVCEGDALVSMEPDGREVRMPELTHFDAEGNAVMVDIGAKADTVRTAAAAGTIFMSADCFAKVCAGGMKKGDVLGAARIAGIMAAKKTAELIPLCHILGLTGVEIRFLPDAASSSITAECTAKTVGKTGVEMEALTGVQIALLTVYDMCKAVDRGMHMENIRLLSKSGGKSGDWRYEG